MTPATMVALLSGVIVDDGGWHAVNNRQARIRIKIRFILNGSPLGLFCERLWNEFKRRQNNFDFLSIRRRMAANQPQVDSGIGGATSGRGVRACVRPLFNNVVRVGRLRASKEAQELHALWRPDKDMGGRIRLRVNSETMTITGMIPGLNDKLRVEARLLTPSRKLNIDLAVVELWSRCVPGE